MTEMELRNHVVETAKAWHGRRESNGTHKPIIDVYNAHKPLARGYRVTYTDAWCATFVSAVAIRCGITDILPTECGCPSMIDLFKKLGRWQEADSYADAKPGDVVFYDWGDNGKGDNTGTPDHVGIVCSKIGTAMQIIEGNIDNAVGYRTLQVNEKHIRGYGLPDYAKKATGYTAPSSTTSVSTDTVIHTVAKDDSLWFIAEQHLGNGNLYPQIMAANNLTTTWIYPGMQLKIPVPGKVEEVKAETTGGDSDMKTCTPTLPQLRFGDNGQAVKALQTLLILHGYKLPNHGVDGDFGTETQTVLELFQKKHGLTVDGIAGAATWKAMVG